MGKKKEIWQSVQPDDVKEKAIENLAIASLGDVPMSERTFYVEMFNEDGRPIYVKREWLEAMRDPDPELQATIRGHLRWWMAPKVKGIEELQARTTYFFVECEKNNETPTYEKYCLALGATQQQVQRWSKGLDCDSLWQNVILSAIGLLSGIAGDLASTGKHSFQSYQTRARSFFGLSDKTNIDISVTNNHKIDNSVLEKDILESIMMLDMEQNDTGIYEVKNEGKEKEEEPR